MRKYIIREDLFDTIDSEDSAYILGVLAADGHINDKKRGFKLAIQHSDKQWLDTIDHTIYLDGMDHTKYYLLPVDKRTGKRYERSTLWVYSAHMIRQLIRCGITPRKSATLKYPEVISNSPISVQKHFIRGYYDGDGCLSMYQNKQLVDIQVTKEFGEVLQQVLLQHLNLDSYLKKDKRSENVYGLRLYGFQAIKTFLDWMYSDSTLRLERKYQKYQELLK